MYVPALFRETDEDLLLQLCTQYAFGMLTAVTPHGEQEIAHLPLVARRQPSGEIRILAHVARANPLAELARAKQRMTAIFCGPHGYVSPTWYAEPTRQVPTWNYAVVHAEGRAAIMPEVELADLLGDLSSTYEQTSAAPWRPGLLAPDLLDGMVQAIVGIDIRVESLVGKFKLSQNRSAVDRGRVAAALAERGHADDVAMLALMRRDASEGSG
jgi:transcriptional regulator